MPADASATTPAAHGDRESHACSPLGPYCGHSYAIIRSKLSLSTLASFLTSVQGSFVLALDVDAVFGQGRNRIVQSTDEDEGGTLVLGPIALQLPSQPLPAKQCHPQPTGSSQPLHDTCVSGFTRHRANVQQVCLVGSLTVCKASSTNTRQNFGGLRKATNGREGPVKLRSILFPSGCLAALPKTTLYIKGGNNPLHTHTHTYGINELYHNSSNLYSIVG